MRIREKRDAVPFARKSLPPGQVGSETGVEANRGVRLAAAGYLSRVEQVNHPPQEGTTRTYNLAGVIEMTNQRLQVPSCARLPIAPLG